MNNDPHQHQTHIIKRIKKIRKHHQGGSWKIAYADFVTAMMAFFLLMWLLSLLNKYQLEGVARYFKKPLKEMFTKQDSIATTDTNRPDMLGPTTQTNTGARDKNSNSLLKNAGEADEKKKATNINHQNTGVNTVKEADSINSSTSLTTQITPIKNMHPVKQQSSASLAQLKALRDELQKKVNADPEMQPYKNLLNFVITADGLKIELRDLDKKPMFSEGKTDFQQYAKKILGWLTSQINGYPNSVVVIGHTDGVPYSNSGNYSNWELSADRANATRRALIQSGMPDDKIIRIIGVADKNLLNKSDSLDPSNRRIEIVILTNDAAKKMDAQ